MNYNFLTVSRPEPHAMGRALAEAVGVELSQVDVAHLDADPDARNWGAAVLCAYEPVLGDLALSWEVFVTDGVPDPPAEVTAAERVARATGTTVLCPAVGLGLPSTHWAVTPEGQRTLVREYETEGPEPVCSVEVVEEPVFDFPGAQVRLLPEVYGADGYTYPITDAFVAATDPGREAEPQSMANRARETLSVWEEFARRAAADWAPLGRYPEESYVDDLRARDRLTDRLRVADPALRGPLARAVDEIDAIYRVHTDADDGAFLGRLTRSGSAVKDRGWWWQRRPRRVPWVR
ncbi:hypothetical protein [Streptomyces sp. NBC_00385]|uniref:hypothetical protein n=1 Tax=Streptomyces sp. NBC_00385 TaxID=2975733 RepID=UPI002DDB081F|nr:hypothetical protein [Streptomyces sp. NBC_00385]WRZ04194.1 hypothetical protein OG959_12925 [Streptomyces sp. NBC_00385]